MKLDKTEREFLDAFSECDHLDEEDALALAAALNLEFREEEGEGEGEVKWASCSPAPRMPFELRLRLPTGGFVHPTQEEMEEAARDLNRLPAMETLARELAGLPDELDRCVDDVDRLRDRARELLPGEGGS